MQSHKVRYRDNLKRCSLYGCLNTVTFCRKSKYYVYLSLGSVTIKPTIIIDQLSTTSFEMKQCIGHKKSMFPAET